MRDLESDPRRAAGASVVWSGPADGPVVIVLDPAGEAPHGELPATWRPLADHLRIAWHRLPAGDQAPSREIFADLSGRQGHVHLVASGQAGLPALRLVAEHPTTLRTVTVVDPMPADGTAASESDTRAWWDRQTGSLRSRLADSGVEVHCFVSREDDPAMRTERPVPLGHPDVVGRVVEFLLSSVRSGTDGGGSEPVEAERRDELAQAWQRVKELVAEPMRRARQAESNPR